MNLAEAHNRYHPDLTPFHDHLKPLASKSEGIAISGIHCKTVENELKAEKKDAASAKDKQLLVVSG